MTSSTIDTNVRPKCPARGRLPCDKSFRQHFNRLKRGTGTQDDRDQDRDLKRIEHQTADVQFCRGFDDVLPEALPMGDDKGDDGNQGSEPEQHIGETNSWNIFNQIGFERRIKIQEDQKDDQCNQPKPEPSGQSVFAFLCHVVPLLAGRRFTRFGSMVVKIAKRSNIYFCANEFG